MYVVKRDGRQEPVHFDKITNRIRKLAWKLAPSVDPVQVAKKVMCTVFLVTFTPLQNNKTK